MNDEIKELLRDIEVFLKELWVTTIQYEYQNLYLLRESSLRETLVHHIRNRFESRMIKNNLRIYTEYLIVVKDKNYIADIAIVKIDPNKECKDIKDAKEELLQIFELKYKVHSKDCERAIKNDVQKIKKYMSEQSLSDCNYYFVVIYEGEDHTIFWTENRKFKEKVTELAAGYYMNQKKITFDVYPKEIIR